MPMYFADVVRVTKLLREQCLRTSRCMEIRTEFDAGAPIGNVGKLIAKPGELGPELIRTEYGSEVRHISHEVEDVLKSGVAIRVTSDDEVAP